MTSDFLIEILAIWFFYQTASLLFTLINARDGEITPFTSNQKLKKKHVINILDSPSGYHFLDCGVAYELSGRPKKSWRHMENKQISYNLWTKPKDSVRWGSFQQKLQHLCFYVWLPAFITSLFSNYVCTFYFVCGFLNFSQKVSEGS